MARVEYQVGVAFPPPGMENRTLSGTAETPLPLCSLPAQHSLGSWPLSEVAPPSHLMRTPRATGLSGLEFLVFVIVFFQIKFQKSGFKNNREIQSSPPSCLAETNPQQRPMCSLASHLLIFRCQLSSVLGGEEKDSLGSKDKGPGAGHKPGLMHGWYTPLWADSCLRLLRSPVFLGGPACWSLALVWAGDQSSSGKRSPLVIQNSFSFPGGTSASGHACLSPS